MQPRKLVPRRVGKMRRLWRRGIRVSYVDVTHIERANALLLQVPAGSTRRAVIDIATHNAPSFARIEQTIRACIEIAKVVGW